MNVCPEPIVCVSLTVKTVLLEKPVMIFVFEFAYVSLPPIISNFSCSESPEESVTVFTDCVRVTPVVSKVTFFAILSPARICCVAL